MSDPDLEVVIDDISATIATAIDAWEEALEGWGEALAMLRAHLDFSVDLRPRG